MKAVTFLMVLGIAIARFGGVTDEDFEPGFVETKEAYVWLPDYVRVEQMTARGEPFTDGAWNIERGFDHACHWEWQMAVSQN